MLNLREIYETLCMGMLNPAYDYRQMINQRAIELIQKESLDQNDVNDLKTLIDIGNVTYNNLDKDLLPIDDSIYDLMIEKYRRYTPDDSYPVGGKPVQFDNNPKEEQVPDWYNEDEREPLMVRMKYEEIKYMDNMMYPELMNNNPCRPESFAPKQILEIDKADRKMRDTAHNHPTLVGTFDKCKYVLTSQAEEHGVDKNANVRIVERDFLYPLVEKGIINLTDEFTIIAELKYDGISVEADVTDHVISARSRGDTGEGVASDITPLLEGYQFYNGISEVIGMKFEAIVQYQSLYDINAIENTNYKNCRTAMSGLTSNSFGRKFRDYITLVPIATDMVGDDGYPLDRLTELEFLNKYYSTGIPINYTVFSGNYYSILYQMKRYVEEAEYARHFSSFMYDGVVFEFYDRNIRHKLGRSNAIDKYKVAVKFDPLKAQTVFRGYSYTVGQNGVLTPMIHFDPVAFIGTIHDKASGHSFNRFKELDLHLGDIIDATYVNDVMVYITKPRNAHNEANAKKPYEVLDSFPERCPFCGSELVMSDSGKSIKCPNLRCHEREIKRMTGTLEKLGIVDFNEQTVRVLDMRYLYEYLEADVEKFKVLGPNDMYNLYNQIQVLKKNPINDYKVFGSLGFENMAIKTWRLIFTELTMDEIFHYYQEYNGDLYNLRAQLNSIHGIGPVSIDTLINEFPYFARDIESILKNMNIIDTKTLSIMDQKQIRFTGCRDQQLTEQLSKLGYDIDGNAGITKKTDILIIPYEGFTHFTEKGTSKYEKALKYGIKMIPLEAFRENPDLYLKE